jgi:hypothetical protein
VQPTLPFGLSPLQHDALQFPPLTACQQFHKLLQHITWYSLIASMPAVWHGGWPSDESDSYQCNPAMKSRQLSSFTWISFTRLVGSIRRSDDIKSPLWVFSGNRVTGMNRRRCFSLFSTIAPPHFTRLVVDY